MTPREFIDKIAQSATDFYHDHKISAALTIAQGCFESGYGKYAPGNNVFGIKADASWHGATITAPTQEYVNGAYVTVQSKFRAYATLGDSLIDHGNFLLDNPRYDNLKGAPWIRAVVLIRQDGYATDPTYSQTLKSLIQQWGLQKFDTVTKYAVEIQSFADRDAAERVAKAVALLGYHSTLKKL